MGRARRPMPPPFFPMTEGRKIMRYRSHSGPARPLARPGSPAHRRYGVSPDARRPSPAPPSSTASLLGRTGRAPAAETGFLPFALPDIGQEEIDEVVDSLRSGWLTTGPKVHRFEHEFARFIGGPVEALAVNSATSGLHLALEALGIGAGDEVITSPYTFTATAEVIRYLGARPVFVDIDPGTLNIDPARIESAITPRTKAIIPVHFAGLPCEMASILALANQHGLKVVEDAAHALPATYRGTTVGALGSDATVFSFYATKTLATGEGGMVVTRDPAIAARCRVMRLHGITRDVFDRYTATKPAWQYEVVSPGFKYNMTDVAASLGIHQLAKATAMQQKRQRMASVYNEALAGLPIVLPPTAPGGETHAWHLYVIRLCAGALTGRHGLIEALPERGIGTSVHFIPLHIHPYWRDTYGLRPQDFPHALASYERAVSLPLYTRMTDRDQQRVISGLQSLLG
jgi:dTDP-4-amino-4,6-dideoxygalactose transaminase